MVPTQKQQELIDSLKNADDQWNDFDSLRVAEVLESHLDAWEWGYWSPGRADTILLVPNNSYLCHKMGQWTDANEIDEYDAGEALNIIFRMWDREEPYPKEYEAALGLFEGVTNVIRLWWD